MYTIHNQNIFTTLLSLSMVCSVNDTFCFTYRNECYLAYVTYLKKAA